MSGKAQTVREPPNELKSIKPFILRGNQLRTADPVITYYCKLHSIPSPQFVGRKGKLDSNGFGQVIFGLSNIFWGMVFTRQVLSAQLGPQILWMSLKRYCSSIYIRFPPH